MANKEEIGWVLEWEAVKIPLFYNGAFLAYPELGISGLHFPAASAAFEFQRLYQP